MKINFTQLKQKITLQTSMRLNNHFGDEIISWHDLEQVWAAILVKSAHLQVHKHSKRIKVSHIITIRSNPVLTLAMRIKYQDRHFRINNIAEAQNSKYQIIYASEEI